MLFQTHFSQVYNIQTKFSAKFTLLNWCSVKLILNYYRSSHACALHACALTLQATSTDVIPI